MNDPISSTPPTVFVVDDDPQVREALALLLDSVEVPIETFESASAFLLAFDPARSGCVVLDVRMPGMSGLELLRKLRSQGVRIPILLLTAHAEVSMAVEAMKAGAMDFIEKPYSPQVLLDRIQQVLKLDARHQLRRAEVVKNAQRFESLSEREDEVLRLLVQGGTSKEIAFQLHISPSTVDFHRRNLLGKLGVESPVELGRRYESYLLNSLGSLE